MGILKRKKNGDPYKRAFGDYKVAPPELGTPEYSEDIVGIASLLESYAYNTATPWEKWTQMNAGVTVAETRNYDWSGMIPLARSLSQSLGKDFDPIFAVCWVGHTSYRATQKVTWWEVDDSYVIRDGDFVRFEVGTDWARDWHDDLVPLPLTEDQEAALRDALMAQRDRLKDLEGS